MRCYKDRAFCASDCQNTDCERLLTEKILDEAVALGLGIQSKDYRAGCDDYAPKPKDTEGC